MSQSITALCDKIIELDKKDLLRFISKIKKTKSCWYWIGALSYNKESPSHRYGNFYYKGKIIRAHRFSYTHFIGQIPKGMFVCHKCDNTRCVNPEHLFVGTTQDNMDDMMRKKRHDSFWKKKEYSQRMKEMISKRDKHPNQKLSKNDIEFIRANYKCIGRKSNASELATKFNVNRTYLRAVATGKRGNNNV